MKKILSSLLCGGLLLASASSYAASVSLTVMPNTMTNLMPAGFSGFLKLQQVNLTSLTNSTLVYLYDCPSNNLANAILPYTNTLSVVSNTITTWVDYLGKTNSMTNFCLIDYTNNVFLGSTNPYPVRLAAGAASSTPVTINPLNTYFSSGIWATNASTNTAVITINFQN